MKKLSNSIIWAAIVLVTPTPQFPYWGKNGKLIMGILILTVNIVTESMLQKYYTYYRLEEKGVYEGDTKR